MNSWSNRLRARSARLTKLTIQTAILKFKSLFNAPRDQYKYGNILQFLFTFPLR